MATEFIARIHSESEQQRDGIMLGCLIEGIPTLPGRAPHIEFRDLPEAVAAQIGRRGGYVRITVEAIPAPEGRP